MRRGFLLRLALPIACGVFLGLQCGHLLGRALTPFTATGTVTRITPDYEHDIDYFEIRFGGAQGAVIVSVDTDLPLAEWLRAARGTRIGVELDRPKD